MHSILQSIDMKTTLLHTKIFLNDKVLAGVLAGWHNTNDSIWGYDMIRYRRK